MPVLPRQALIEIGAMVASDPDTRIKTELPDEWQNSLGHARLCFSVHGHPPGIAAYLECWAAHWARLAYPLIQPSHKYAAALMATTVPVDIDIRPPWPAFYLAVPPGLITILDRNGKPEPVEQMLVFAEKERWSYVSPAETVEFSRIAHTKVDMASERGASDPSAWSDFSIASEDHDDRAGLCLSRLLLNSCLAMSDPSAVRQIGKAHSTRSSTPQAKVFELSRPVRVDCRDSVRSFVTGTSSRLAQVQWLVRGHWRQQAYGKEHKLRRNQWIEPFWKGGDDKPLAVRVHKLDRGNHD